MVLVVEVFFYLAKQRKNFVIRVGRGEFTELVADHVIRHENGDEFVAVMKAKRQADKLRQDRGATAPGFDDGALATIQCLLNLL